MASTVHQPSEWPLRGLTEAQAQARRREGRGNDQGIRSGRSYWDIARANLFTFFNNLLFAIGVALVALGQYGDAIASVGLGLVNALIGVIQEARAKRKLDRITLLTRPTVTVVRDDRERAIDPAELVAGDVVRVDAGDQVAADGTLVGEGQLEMDESLLTGETELVAKRAGDALLSGSVCVIGSGCYEAERVGADSYAGRLTREVREFQVRKTPLQRRIELAVRLITLVVVLMSFAILLQAALENLPLTRVVQISAVLSGQVPYGLFFMAAVAYTLGAASMARHGALAQQVNAVESLSSVDVLCMDKTGTLTANRERLHDLEPLDGAHAEAARVALGALAHGASVTNVTTAALAEALPGDVAAPADEVPFASARRWSAVSFADGPQRGVWVLGALEALAPSLPADRLAADGALSERVAEWTRAGLRVLVLAHATDVTALHGEAGEPRLPPLVPVAVVALEDELRPGVQEALAEFTRLGVDLKVISGDDARTVAALARRAGLGGPTKVITGDELERMSPTELEEVASETTIFGRASSKQKERIITALRRRGDYVAMIGDGVNDAGSLKRANLGIAMESASNVTRDVADIVLLGDSFGSLGPAVAEGRRIVTGLAHVMYLFLTRVATSTLLILAIAVVGLDFPYEPAQTTLTLFTVGIPSFFLTLWARPEAPAPGLLRSVASFALPAAIVTAIVGVAIYTISYQAVLTGVETGEFPPTLVNAYQAYTGLTLGEDASFAVAAATIDAQTMLSLFVSITAFGLILFLEPPSRLFTAWTERSPDRRPALLVAGLFAVFLVVVLTPRLANYFALVRIEAFQGGILTIAVLVWFLALNVVWRLNLLERMFSLDERA